MSRQKMKDTPRRVREITDLYPPTEWTLEHTEKVLTLDSILRSKLKAAAAARYAGGNLG
jgi:hypothetical protein